MRPGASEAHIVGIVGAGAMGRGIAQVAVLGGLSVLLYDNRVDAVDQAREFIAKIGQSDRTRVHHRGSSHRVRGHCGFRNR